MNASLEKNVEILSDHYVQRFKFLLEGEMLNLQVKRHKDAYSIHQEYLCNDGESYALTFDEEIALRDTALGIYEADDEDDLIEIITDGTGYCIKSIELE